MGVLWDRLGADPRRAFEKYVDVSCLLPRGELETLSPLPSSFPLWWIWVADDRVITQAIIDLLIPGQTPGIKEPLVDLYEKPELLFFGPDGEKLFCTLGLVFGVLLKYDYRGYCGYDGLGSK